jgi:hypothetical protein
MKPCGDWTVDHPGQEQDPEQPPKKRILHLTLLRHWFDEIASGRKTVEYRENKRYWDTRLRKPMGKGWPAFQHWDEVHFRNGYAKNAPFMRVEYVATGVKGDSHGIRFAIHLGKVIEIKNWKRDKSETP